MNSKKPLHVLLMVISFLAVAQSAPFPNWEDRKSDYFLQPQEVAPTILSCYECTTNCSTVQTSATCKAGFSCYTLQAFDTVLNKSVFIKGCIPAFFCTDNRGCSYMNQSLSGALGSCSISCCHVSLCNPGAITPAPSLTTTSPPTTTTAPPTTTPSPTTTPPPTTTPAPTTTAPPTTLPTTLPITVPTTIPIRHGLCGGPLASPTGYFASPHHPRHYPNNAYCVWTILVPLGSVLKIDFLFFKTEECYDFLEIYVGRRLVRHLTGDDIDDDDDDDDDDDIRDCDDKDDKDYGKDIFSWYFFKDEEVVEDEELDDETVTIQGTGEMIRLVFSSDRSITKRGFFAKYNVMQAICGGPLPFPSGSFSSPGYPGNYPDDVKCVWTIAVPPGSVLEIEFRSFETEICDDYVKILQGGRKVRRLSGVYNYGLFGWGDDDDDCDDDGDDDDGDDKGDGDGDGYYRRRERVKRMFGYPGGSRFGFPMRSRHVPPYVIRVTIPGTGELISIIFKSDDDDDTEKGFEAVYRVSRGAVFG